jgi:uncharacterized membrane protein
MWDRTVLKLNAKLALRGHYLTAYIVCLVSSLINSIFASLVSSGIDSAYLFSPFYSIKRSKAPLLAVVQILVTIFVILPLSVGVARFFVRNHFGTTDAKMVLSGFSMDYSGTLGNMAAVFFIVFLGTLLLVIPGIIMALKYCMVPYILSDNPSISGKRARQISNLMTYGEKESIFILYLSFFGWYLLAWAAAGVMSKIVHPLGWLFTALAYAAVAVYVDATVAELYIFMRDRAIRSGIVSPAELNLSPAEMQ